MKLSYQMSPKLSINETRWCQNFVAFAKSPLAKSMSVLGVSFF